MELTHLDLFSGIGGFALAARWAGIKTIQFVELDNFCCKVLNKNFPGVLIHNDIKTFKYKAGEPVETEGFKRGEYQRPASDPNWNGLQESRTEQQASRDRQLSKNIFTGESNNNEEKVKYNETSTRPFLLTGGFPCQPFSCAGKQRGTADDRYLWPEMLRVISEANPRWIIGENVRGFISNNNGMVFENCCLDLEREGYSVQAFIIPACAINAPHRRDRVWIVANRRCEHGEGREVNGKSDRPLSCEENASLPERPISHDGQGIDTNSTNSGIENLRREWENSVFQNDLHTNGKPIQGRRVQSDGSEPSGLRHRKNNQWEENWIEVATRLCGIHDGTSEELYKLETSDRVARLKALGNGIVPQVAFQIMKAILESERSPI